MPASKRALLLDTHFWIWMHLGERGEFEKKVADVERAASEGRLLVSVISVWELGMLQAKGRLRLTIPCEQWIAQALATPGLALVPLTPEIAIASSRLPGEFHGAPADRIIAATARSLGARLLTKDRRLIEYGKQGHLTIH